MRTTHKRFARRAGALFCAAAIGPWLFLQSAAGATDEPVPDKSVSSGKRAGNVTTCKGAGLAGQKLVDGADISATVSDNKYLSFTTALGVTVTGAVVKGGNGYNVYYTAQSDLHAPRVGKGGKNVPDISHWFVCGTLSSGEPSGDPSEPSDEETSPSTEEPSFKNPTCNRPQGSVTIPESDLWWFYINDADGASEPGTYPVPAGKSVTITAKPRTNYPVDQSPTWTHDFPKARGCSSSGGGSTETSTVTPTASPTTAVLGEKVTASPTPVVAGGKLPYTGSPVAATAALSAALLAGGALLLAASKRRRAGTHC